MPELFAGVFVSVDGSAFGTRSPGYFGPELERWISEEQARPRRHLMGRKTYEALAALPDEHRDEGWEQTTASRPPCSPAPSHADWSGVELCAEDAIDAVRRRKVTGDSDLRTIGSLSLVQQFLRAGLVDHLRLMVFPW